MAVRLRSLDGEAGAGEAPGPAVEGANSLLHPPPDRGDVAEEGDSGCGQWLASGNGIWKGVKVRWRHLHL